MLALLDNMMLNYLVKALRAGYDPAQDDDEALREERVAAVRLLFWGEIGVGETAVRQSRRAPDPAWRMALDRLVAIQLDEYFVPEGTELEGRVVELTEYHRDPHDCRIVAEAEVLAAPAVVTFDFRMKRRLSEHTDVPIWFASEYWDRLAIPRGTPPRRPPAPGNPLANAHWWRWE